jgi:hypothetical protein
MAKTLTTPPPASSSTPGTPRSSTPVRRVRRKADPAVYTVVPAGSAQVVSVLGGQRYAHPGDLLITNEQGIAVDVLPPDALSQFYEPADPDGTLTLSPSEVSRCAKLLRLGATKSAAEFTQAVEALVHVSIGGVEVVWSPGQVAELKHRAAKRNQTVQQYVEQLVARFTQDIWTIAP